MPPGYKSARGEPHPPGLAFAPPVPRTWPRSGADAGSGRSEKPGGPVFSLVCPRGPSRGSRLILGYAAWGVGLGRAAEMLAVKLELQPNWQ